MGEAYAFRPLQSADIPQLHRYLHEPHVRRWWGDPDHEARLMHTILDEPETRAFVVSHGGTLFAYAQAWRTEAAGAYLDQPAGTHAIDVFIGPNDMLGRGHGAGLIAAFAARLLAAGAARVVTDPDAANYIAKKAYTRAGFRSLGERNTPDGPVVLMARDPGQGKT